MVFPTNRPAIPIQFDAQHVPTPVVLKQLDSCYTASTHFYPTLGCHKFGINQIFDALSGMPVNYTPWQALPASAAPGPALCPGQPAVQPPAQQLQPT